MTGVQTCALPICTFDIVAKEYPNVGTAYNHVDAACIYFVQDPQRYDVIVTDNLFGDILTDLGGAVSGGIGLASSANLNPARTGPSMFEPVHGSAPDIVGTAVAPRPPPPMICRVGAKLNPLPPSTTSIDSMDVGCRYEEMVPYCPLEKDTLVPCGR